MNNQVLGVGNQPIILHNGQPGTMNTLFGADAGPISAGAKMVMAHDKLTESQYMGMRELDIHHATGGQISNVGIYLQDIEENWKANLQATSFNPSPEMTAKFHEYYDKIKTAHTSCTEMSYTHDVDSSSLIRYLTLQAKVVTISTFIVGLRNDYKKAAMNVRAFNEDQANTAIYLSKNQVFEKIEQGRFNELTVEDMKRMKSIPVMTSMRVEAQIMMQLFADMLCYMMVHYAQVMQTLQNLAHMPTEDGNGLLSALEKTLWLDNNKLLLYKAQMGQVMKEFQEQHPELNPLGDDGGAGQAKIEALAYQYRMQNMPYDVAWQRASAEVAAERNKLVNDEMNKYHNIFITNNKITNPQVLGIPTQYNASAIGIQPVSPGMGTVRVGVTPPASPVGMMPNGQYGVPQPQYQTAPNYTTPTVIQANPTTVAPATPPVNYGAAPLFPNGVPNMNMQEGQQVYNNNGQYIPVTNNQNNQAQNGLVNINGVMCKETSPGSGTYVVVNNAPSVPKNGFDLMYPNGIM